MSDQSALPPVGGRTAFSTIETIKQSQNAADQTTEFALRFFGLGRDPFSYEPEQDFFYSNSAIREVYNRLITALVEKPGIAMLTGEGGIGKTILVRRLCDELRTVGHTVISRYRAGLVYQDLVKTIAEEMGIAICPAEDGPEWLGGFHRDLAQLRASPPPILVIDDAEALGGDVITAMGDLLPQDRAEGSSLRILLSGRPNLATRLGLPVFARLRARLTVHCHLERLDDGHAAGYVFHRLRRAGYRVTDLCTSAAINSIVEHAAGLPRSINLLCAQSLISAALARKSIITDEVVEEAAGELLSRSPRPIPPKQQPRLPPKQQPRRAAYPRAVTSASMAAGIIAISATVLIASFPAREGGPDEDQAASTLREAASPQIEVVAASSAGPGNNADPAPVLVGPKTQQTVQSGSAEADTVPAEPSVDPATDWNLHTNPADDDTSGLQSSADTAASSEARAAITELVAGSGITADQISDPSGQNAPEANRRLTLEPDRSGVGRKVDQVETASEGSERGPLNAGEPEEARRFNEPAPRPEADVPDADLVANTALPNADSAADSAAEAMPADPEQPKAEPVSQQPQSSATRQSGDPAPPQSNTQSPSMPATQAPVQAAPAAVTREPGSSMPAQANDKSSPVPAATPARTPNVVRMSDEIMGVLMKRGAELVALGDISAARLVYERAASGGSAKAMTELGKTYDPAYLERSNVRGIRPDLATAADWYRKAVALGDAEAVSLSEHLPTPTRY